jgi:hypothetical protein
MHLTVRTTPAPLTSISAEVGGQTMTEQGPTPNYIGAPQFRLFLKGLIADVRYAIVITTP